jgi:hypothetical protein
MTCYAARHNPRWEAVKPDFLGPIFADYRDIYLQPYLAIAQQDVDAAFALCAQKRAIPRGRENAYREIFMQKALLLPDRPAHVLFSASLASPAAEQYSVGEVWWDLAPGMDFFSEEFSGFVFPPLALKNWYEFRGVLAGKIGYDFKPAGLRASQQP